MQFMKNNIGWCVVIGVALFGVMPLWAAGADEGYALLIQQSPPDGGVVTPGSGVHRAPIGETVSLSAVPKSGYRFMYWLGDVENSSAHDTTISVDAPKMVVAVFSRENHDEELPSLGIVDGVSSAGGGGGRYFNPVSGPGSVSPASGPADVKFVYNFPDPPIIDEGNDIPVPKDGADVPVPNIPEPATVLLVGLGGLMLRLKCNKAK